MNTGAYGTYPRLRRTRKRIGRRTRTPYRKVNPNKQFTYAKSRVGRYTKTNLQSVKCTYTDQIQLFNGSTYTFQSTNTYLNLAYILANSPEFISRSTQYSYFMINGMSVSYTRKWIDPIALGVNGSSAGFISLAPGLARLSTNFYPNLLSATVGSATEDAESSWVVSPFIHGEQSHYQPFPKNFTTGSNSFGLGVWNATNGYSNIAGQLSLYNDAAVTASDDFPMRIWDMDVQLYISFCNNTGA